MSGKRREYPIDCELGDFLIVDEVEGDFVQKDGREVSQIVTEGPDGTGWVFEKTPIIPDGVHHVADCWVRTS